MDVTNGEMTTMSAIMFGLDPDDVLHTVILIVKSDEHTLGMRTTECKEHTRKLLMLAFNAIEDMEDEDFDTHSH